jgi:hypothetical protein
MRDPERPSETGGGDPGEQMLRAARRYRVSESTRQRAFAAAGLVAGGSVAAGGKAVAAGVALNLRWWIVLAGLAGLSAGGYFLVARHALPSAAPSVAVSAATQVQPAQQETPPADSQAAIAAPNTSIGDIPPRGAPSGGARPSAAPRQAPADLQAELAALDAASKTLRRGDPNGALALLDAYGRDFPRRSLALEATVLRAEALEGAGRHAEAVAVARAFVRQHPKSPLVDRMRQIAGE